MLGILDANISLARAGAVAQYVEQGAVIFCGGQSMNLEVHQGISHDAFCPPKMALLAFL